LSTPAQAYQYFAYLDQGEQWVPKSLVPVQIADMDPIWRYNAARFLLRENPSYLFRDHLGEAFKFWLRGPHRDSVAAVSLERSLKQEHAEREADPEAWLKTTALYQALVEGLPDNVAELATHWSTCPVRAGRPGECTCSHHAAMGGAQ
jgi:hypothetical protein